MTKKRKIALILASIGFVAVAVALVGIISSIQNTASDSIGIIGGADGPTATLVTRLLPFSTPFGRLLLGGIGCLIAAAILASTKGKS